MKLSQLKNIIKESIKEIQLNEAEICGTEEVPCDCKYALPVKPPCAGTRTIYCNGAYNDDCDCCKNTEITQGGERGMFKYK